MNSACWGSKEWKPLMWSEEGSGLWFWFFNATCRYQRRYKPRGGVKKRRRNYSNMVKELNHLCSGQILFPMNYLQCSGQEKVPPIRQRGLLKQQWKLENYSSYSFLKYPANVSQIQRTWRCRTAQDAAASTWVPYCFLLVTSTPFLPSLSGCWQVINHGWPASAVSA